MNFCVGCIGYSLLYCDVGKLNSLQGDAVDWIFNLHQILRLIEGAISLIGSLVILFGVLIALYSFARLYFNKNKNMAAGMSLARGMNAIHLNLARNLTLGLEFIVAADLIGTTTAPDYYSLGILAGIVVIRIVLNFSLNREVAMLSKETDARSAES